MEKRLPTLNSKELDKVDTKGRTLEDRISEKEGSIANKDRFEQFGKDLGAGVAEVLKSKNDLGPDLTFEKFSGWREKMRRGQRLCRTA
jgi:hypothetical protein